MLFYSLKLVVEIVINEIETELVFFNLKLWIFSLCKKSFTLLSDFTVFLRLSWCD